MMDIRYTFIVLAFLIYYLLVIIIEKKIIHKPSEILDKFLSVLLLYAGTSLIYFSLTGKPFLTDSADTYTIYIFVIGFIAILWTIPNLLEEFTFFNKFFNPQKKKK